MVGIVIVSHSIDLANGVRDIAKQMAEEVKIETAGGTEDGRIGTDISKITNAILNSFDKDGVIILFDLGSALMNTEMALEFLDDDIKNKVKILDAPIVEGAIVSAVLASQNKNIAQIEEELKSLKINKLS